jgi:hypothetical protein
MTAKPTYLGLLNAIANAEADAECYLDAWAGATCRDDVRQVLATVALREGEHSKAFAKRMCELGFGVQRRDNPELADKVAIARSTTLTDREKFEKLNLVAPLDPETPDIFAGMMRDQSIDIGTSALLGRYIGEERDSGRMLRGCYAALRAEEDAGAPAGHADAASALEDRLARIEAKLDQLANACLPS